MRGGTKYAWVKLHVNGWLHGSIRYQLTPEERGVWADLIALAGQCQKGGKIEDNDGRAFPWNFLANQLNIPKALLERTIEKCEAEGRIMVNGELMALTNWPEYQSEYERQKSYREVDKT